jgi:hypothetical protein
MCFAMAATFQSSFIPLMGSGDLREVALVSECSCECWAQRRPDTTTISTASTTNRFPNVEAIQLSPTGKRKRYDLARSYSQLDDPRCSGLTPEIRYQLIQRPRHPLVRHLLNLGFVPGYYFSGRVVRSVRFVFALEQHQGWLAKS